MIVRSHQSRHPISSKGDPPLRGQFPPFKPVFCLTFVCSCLEYAATEFLLFAQFFPVTLILSACHYRLCYKLSLLKARAVWLPRTLKITSDHRGLFPRTSSSTLSACQVATGKDIWASHDVEPRVRNADVSQNSFSQLGQYYGYFHSRCGRGFSNQSVEGCPLIHPTTSCWNRVLDNLRCQR